MSGRTQPELEQDQVRFVRPVGCLGKYLSLSDKSSITYKKYFCQYKIPIPEENNPREVFTVVESPTHGKSGLVFLRGRLTNHELNMTADTGALRKKIQE